VSSARQTWLRVPTTNLVSGVVALGDDASHYVSRVHRRAAGETVLLFDPVLGTEAVAEIVAVEGKRVTCRVGEIKAGARRGVAGLHLVQGLGKGDKPDQVVRDGVVLGAQSIRFVTCERSVAQPTARDAAKLERLIRIATEAARQCGRSNLPTIQLGVGFDDVALGALPNSDATAMADGDPLVLVLQPGEQLPLVEDLVTHALVGRASVQVSIWVGPEGGFSEGELTTLISHGARLASLGDLVLRTELAAVVALARVGARLTQAR
jgi:16S rRNA (uracil1498-N3)-methyltransferase